MKQGFSLKWAIAWIVILSISVWIMSLLLVSITNQIVYIILAGLGITIIAKIVRAITLKERFESKDFVLWLCINIFSFWFVGFLISFVTIPDKFLSYILMGIGMFVIGQLVQRIQ
jgi:hypothetical protein